MIITFERKLGQFTEPIEENPIDVITGESIQRNRLIRIKVSGTIYTYDIQTLKRILQTQNRPKEPTSNIPFTGHQINFIRDHPYRLPRSIVRQHRREERRERRMEEREQREWAAQVVDTEEIRAPINNWRRLITRMNRVRRVRRQNQTFPIGRRRMRTRINPIHFHDTVATLLHMQSPLNTPRRQLNRSNRRRRGERVPSYFTNLKLREYPISSAMKERERSWRY